MYKNVVAKAAIIPTIYLIDSGRSNIVIERSIVPMNIAAVDSLVAA